ncbi:hypothetical protein CFC21_071931 [Triticum aestivum]|uniref:Cyclin-dependent kinase inhibitor domain-containing protein n=2 Tax=Triticum aestivum TaxID=4565 RepID=A0A3B6LN45_WHEAT|nr:hypothetical protein CFC21_071931 [Triticum aestivum]
MAATAAAIVTATAAASSCSKRESVGIAAPADLSVSSSLPSFSSRHGAGRSKPCCCVWSSLLTLWLLPVVVRRTKKAKKGRSPPAEEMEAFFAAAEGDVARRFAAKYNYNVVTDAPMDGRYEWVRVRP